MWTPPDKIRHAIPPARWPSAEEAAASRWFSPIDVGPTRLHARTWVPAMVPWRASDDGLVTPDVIAWYERFAAGEPGALVVEATGIRDVPSGPLLRIGDDRFVPGLADLVAAVRAASGGRTRLFVQLIDFLAVKRRPPPDKFFARFLRVDAGHRRRLADALHEERWLSAPELQLRDRLLSAEPGLLEQVLTDRERRELDYGYRELVTDVDLPHVRDLPRVLPALFAAAAARAEAAGFDGVELHYAHAYTMASFLSRTNTRADGYGGNLEGRARLPLEVLAAVRARLGAGTVVGCRMLGDEVIAGGSDLADAVQFARAFAAAGIDFVSVSKGGKFDDAHQPKVGEAVYPYTGPSGYECMPTVHSDARGPFGRNVALAAAIRAGIRDDGRTTPVVAAGGIHSFDQAEAILAAGHADIVAAARQSLADPDWFAKIRLGCGDEVRRCKFTNYCEALDTQHKQVTCQLWDRVELDEPGIARSHDGRRRLVAPRWRR
ncbi:NADH:flavin oxidoreductase [Nannocystis sp. SCPEA4]|uniref:oxidoreductase n=1 Tax=Nannocystis sp. SCPEA4 TaxID=2996787 RepID=UPI002271224B|nr:NADH:flavin oxidoreductase [Nannocystis sp. SCPEA4]MCY1062422.1 NADH:flavin oxidoreductase [Nannocystis sp. SCPEA4]